VQRWEATGSIVARPSGESVSPLEDHAEFLLGLVGEQADLILDEIVAAMAKAGIAGALRRGRRRAGLVAALAQARPAPVYDKKHAKSGGKSGRRP
jgi:hypothetical protein